MPRTITFRPDGADYEIRIIGERFHPLRDLYYALLRLSWPATIAVIAAGFVMVNCVFALAYVVVGGIANAAPASFADAFFFSIQTMGTIGYGAMYPESAAANVVVVVESITGFTLTALGTGLVFAKFSRPTSRVVFTKEAVISPLNGVPTLMFRVGNERGNQIVDAQIRVVLSRTERTPEGITFYRMIDLTLARSRTLSLSRSFTVLHPIDESSPLFGLSPEAFTESEPEINVLVVGLDDTSMQTVHASHFYPVQRIIWGARHIDILSEAGDGALVLDVGKFHDTEPADSATPT